MKNIKILFLDIGGVLLSDGWNHASRMEAIQKLIEEKINPQKIIFIGIDNPIYMHLGLEDILLICVFVLHRN